MKLKELWENLRSELIVDAAECMSKKLTDEDKMGKLVAMALKTDKVISEAATEWDSLTKLNHELISKNEELLKKLESIQKMQEMQLEVENGLYKRFDHLDEKVEIQISTPKKQKD